MRFYNLQESFNDIFKLKFDIYVIETEITIKNENPFSTLGTSRDLDSEYRSIGNETKGVVQ